MWWCQDVGGWGWCDGVGVRGGSVVPMWCGRGSV